jgi:hypothetical protein
VCKKGGISKSANVRSNRNECLHQQQQSLPHDVEPLPWRNFFQWERVLLLTKGIREGGGDREVKGEILVLVLGSGGVDCGVHVVMLNLEGW